MVDAIIRAHERVSGPNRYAPSPASASDAERPVEAITSTDPASPDGHNPPEQQDQQHAPPPRLEISEDQSGEPIYRMIDPQTGELIRSWDTRDLGRLRDFLHDHHLHLLDKKI